MNFILGFGSTESDLEKEVVEAVASGLANGRTLPEILAPWNDAAERFDKMTRYDAPGRYSIISYYENALQFLHINRNHALSPDGWACMKVAIPMFVPEDLRDDAQNSLLIHRMPDAALRDEIAARRLEDRRDEQAELRTAKEEP